ncbi:MAG: HEAT repeat domain-containing protein [Bacteriovoracia bacterium]
MKHFGWLLVLSLSAYGALPQGKQSPLNEVQRVERFDQAFQNPTIEPQRLKQMAFSLKQKAVPTLIRVMKEAKYPEKNRWQATMLLGQVMGKKSAPFIAKFADHPAWMMRVASLKALAALSMKEYQTVYSRALRDPSLIVRVQALDNISHMKITTLAPNVWNMMYDQTNYSGSTGKRKRTSIVRSIIRTLGDLRYTPAKPALAKLIQKPKYQDLAADLNYSLETITGTKAPRADLVAVRNHWKKSL